MNLCWFKNFMHTLDQLKSFVHVTSVLPLRGLTPWRPEVPRTGKE